MGSIICRQCKKEAEHQAFNLCYKCYKKQWKPESIICILCKKEKYHHARGYCNVCYNKTFHKEYYRLASRKQHSGITKEVFQQLSKKCLLCGFDKIIDVHHLIAKSQGGTHTIDNLVVLCPNHHKMIHHADFSEEIKVQVTQKLKEMKGS